MQIADAGGGPVRLAGDLTFTDSANQPGGASAVLFVGPITVNFDDAPDFGAEKVLYVLPAGGAAVLGARAVVRTAFADGTTVGFIHAGGANYATGDYWTAYTINDLTDDGEYDADSAEFIPVSAGGAAQQGAIAFTGPGAVSMAIDPAWTAGQVDIYLLIAIPTAP